MKWFKVEFFLPCFMYVFRNFLISKNLMKCILDIKPFLLLPWAKCSCKKLLIIIIIIVTYLYCNVFVSGIFNKSKHFLFVYLRAVEGYNLTFKDNIKLILYFLKILLCKQLQAWWSVLCSQEKINLFHWVGSKVLKTFFFQMDNKV